MFGHDLRRAGGLPAKQARVWLKDTPNGSYLLVSTNAHEALEVDTQPVRASDSSGVPLFTYSATMVPRS